jgi:uncharacterized membrane protein YtjA (UPF0391 family)
MEFHCGRSRSKTPEEQMRRALCWLAKPNQTRTAPVFGFAITLLIIALIAAILGFGGIAGTLANIAIAIFVIALIIGLALLFLGWRTAKSVVD